MKKLTAYISVISVITIVFACKKDSQEPVAAIPPPVNYLCTGNGENKIYPQALKNVWKYYQSGSNPDVTDSIVGTQDIGSQTYFHHTVDDGIAIQDEYWRTGAHGDVFKYDQWNLGAEILIVPGNPKVGMKWAIGIDSMKVTSIAATVNTSACTYSGCIAVQQSDSTGTALYDYYFRKGIGLVKRDALKSGLTTLNLYTFSVK